MKNTWKIVLLVATALMTACGQGETEKSKTPTTEDKPLVKLAEVHERLIAQVQEFTATVEAEAINNIAPSHSVRIDKIWVEVGDRVKKGQLLVSMDQASLKQLELQLENKRTEFERTNELYKVGGVSKSEWDATKTAYDVQLTAFEDLKKNTTLSSPINGIVTARNYDNGDLYSGTAPVLVVQQISPVKLIINVSEKYFTQVRTGAPVQLQFDVYGNEQFFGKVNLVYPTIDPVTRTFPVEIRISNTDQRVRPGMFGRATLNFGEKKHVVVPDLAIVKQQGAGDHYVYVYKDGKVSYNKVVLGRRLGTEYELLSGVPSHAKVVIAGQSKLANNIEVKVQ